MSLRHQLAIIRSALAVIVTGTLVAGAAAFVLSMLMPRIYEGESRLLVGQALQSANPRADLFQSARNVSEIYVELADTRQVLEGAMERAGLDLPLLEFERKVRVTAGANQPLLRIVATDEDPEVAASIANAMADELQAVAASMAATSDDLASFAAEDLQALQASIRQVREEIEALSRVQSRSAAQQARLDALEDRLVTLRGSYAALLAIVATAGATELSVIDPAVPQAGPASPRPMFNTLMGLMLGLLVTVGAVFLREKLDDRVRTRDDVARITGLDTLGSIVHIPSRAGRPESHRLATLFAPASPAAEAFRSLRTNIEFANIDQPFRTIVVTSALEGEGKTLVAANLAAAFAQAGRRTILVDADLRDPGVHALFDLPGDVGLTTLVASDAIDVEQAARATGEPNLHVLPAGIVPPNPAELLASDRMDVVAQRLRRFASLVIFDTPPIGMVTDPAVLAAHADATVLVIQASRAREDAVQHAHEALVKVNARTIGVVLNNLPGKGRGPSASYELNPMGAERPVDRAPAPVPMRPARPGPTGTERTAEPAHRYVRSEPAEGGRS